MKKVLFVVAFLSLVGVADAVGETQVDVNAPKDVKVQVEKVDNTVQDKDFKDQCIQKGMTGTYEKVNADGTTVKGKVFADTDDDDDDDDEDDVDDNVNDGARFENVDNSARVFDRE